MKSHLISAEVAGTILIVSLCFSQNLPKTENPATNGPHDYSELTKAPEKARVAPTPFRMIQTQWSPVNFSLKIIAPSATVIQVSVGKRVPACEHQKCKMQLPGPCFG